jgi:hypothetical protein
MHKISAKGDSLLYYRTGSDGKETGNSNSQKLVYFFTFKLGFGSFKSTENLGRRLGGRLPTQNVQLKENLNDIKEE